MSGIAAAMRLLPAMAILCALLIAWQLIATAVDVPEWLLPTPLAIADAILGTRELLAVHAARTLQETLVGLLAATACGLSLATLMDRLPLVRRAIYPLIVASQTVPIIAIAPLLVIWFGYELLPKIIVVALVCFFPITVATLDGLGRVDQDAVRLVRGMGATEWQTFRRVRWPSALPSIFSGIRVGVAYGVIGAIVAEWAGASQGIGIYMIRAADQLLTARVFAAIVVASSISLALFFVVGAIERLVIPWRRGAP